MQLLLHNNRPALASLRRRWAGFSLACLALLWLGFFTLQSAWQPGYALRWLVQTAAVAAYILYLLGRNLQANHRPGESQLLAAFGAGNNLTLLRGILIAALAGFLFSPWPLGWLAWVPGLIFTLATLADFLDGYLARVTNHATRLGEILDQGFDSLGVLTAALLAVQYGQVPVWYLSIALARYLFIGGLWAWKRLGHPVYGLAPSIRRRAFAGVQMGFIFAILWPVFSPPGTHIAAALFALPFLAGFGFDWLVSAGLIRPAKLAAPGLRWISGWLPVLLRLSGAALIASLLLARLLEYPAQAAVGALRGMHGVVFGIAEGLILALLLLGAAGRITSIAGLALLGIQQLYASLNPAQIALVAVYIAILFWGTGMFSLWKPEDRLIYRRAGEKITLHGLQGWDPASFQSRLPPGPVYTPGIYSYHRSPQKSLESQSGPASSAVTNAPSREA